MLTLEQIKSSDNLVNLLRDTPEGKSKLAEIGVQVYRGYEIDEDSRDEWKRTVDEAMKIAKQTTETKNHPWSGASNIKYPLITDAAIDYASRTLPEIIQNEKVVKCATVGMDPDSEKYLRAERISRFMSYQLIQESTDWEDSVDKLLQMLPVLGTVFMKTYYNTLEKKNVSEICVPDKIVVNYDTKSLQSARRVTHILTLYTNDILERQRRGLFDDDIDIKTLNPEAGNEEDEDPPLELLEQHCWLDLDDDGYKEPYIVTVHKESKQVLRIVQRIKDVEKNSDGEICCIYPEKYFTDFHFIRSPDGGFYSMGFGSLLLPLNSAINTLINQLIDSGTLNNSQGGFLGRGLRLKNGEFRIKMGEWKVLDAASGTDIKNNIYPMPTKEPSQTLFNLLGMLVKVGKELSSTTDAMSGQGPGQNVSSSVQNSLIEQGTKVFTAINKRLYRGLKEVYTLQYDLNCKYVDPTHYQEVLNDPLADAKADFDLHSTGVHPVADPTISSMNQRMMRAQMVQGLRTADPHALDVFMLQSLQMDQSQIDILCPKPDPNAPPAPEVQKLLSEVKLNETNARSIQLQTSIDMQKSKMDTQQVETANREADSRIQESVARQWKMQKDAAHGDAKIAIASGKMQQEGEIKQINTLHSIQSNQTTAGISAAQVAIKREKDQSDAQLKAMKIAADIEMHDKSLVMEHIQSGNEMKQHHDKMHIEAAKNETTVPNSPVAPKAHPRVGPAFSMRDIVHTARLKGKSIQSVVHDLNVDYTAKLKGMTPKQVKENL